MVLYSFFYFWGGFIPGFCRLSFSSAVYTHLAAGLLCSSLPINQDCAGIRSCSLRPCETTPRPLFPAFQMSGARRRGPRWAPGRRKIRWIRLQTEPFHSCHLHINGGRGGFARVRAFCFSFLLFPLPLPRPYIDFCLVGSILPCPSQASRLPKRCQRCCIWTSVGRFLLRENGLKGSYEASRMADDRYYEQVAGSWN